MMLSNGLEQLTEIKETKEVKVRREGNDIIVNRYRVKSMITGEYSPRSKVLVRVIDREVLERETLSEQRYTLTEETPLNIKIHRRMGEPSLVLKKGGKLYWAPIPKNMRIGQKLFGGEHICGGGNSTNNVCRRLLALPTEEGGCDKVFNFTKGIENYDFILEGYETFGTQLDVFVVNCCALYGASDPPKRIEVVPPKPIPVKNGKW